MRTATLAALQRAYDDRAEPEYDDDNCAELDDCADLDNCAEPDNPDDCETE